MARELRSAARAVGQAMRGNPFAPVVPCHRVVASDRRLGGFGGATDPESKKLQQKVQMLKDEGVRISLAWIWLLR